MRSCFNNERESRLADYASRGKERMSSALSNGTLFPPLAHQSVIFPREIDCSREVANEEDEMGRGNGGAGRHVRPERRRGWGALQVEQ